MTDELNHTTITSKKAEFGTIVYEAICGNHLYGIQLGSESTKNKGVYVATEENITKDKVSNIILINNTMYYEISFFMDLLIKNDVDAIEMLSVDDNFILLSHPTFKEYCSDRLNLFFNHNKFHTEVLKLVNDSIKDIKRVEVLEKPDHLDYLRVSTDIGNINKSITFSQFLSKEILKNKVSIGNYYSKTINSLHSDYRMLFYNDEKGVDNQQKLLDHNSNFISYATSIVRPSKGVLIFDRLNYNRDLTTYLSSSKHSIVYNENKLARSTKLLDSLIDFYDKSTYRLYFPVKGDKRYLLSIRAKQPKYDAILFDINQKIEIVNELSRKRTKCTFVIQVAVKQFVIDKMRSVTSS
ncbi:hypothetical protein N356_gp052 [Cellulophaga phage phi14:2]|uniref:Uncharacterized protein n=1 Tax=Cellulophaga phage phi14:2 TaxID=1327990 RepID=S0A036_9CAUD|nr:hypothetical protein N356_gp052 [Cellulophaga phage phi14:2]AGO48944.1 hypothetical protein Phi14:2_gp066 [Cellulophaga phage phi14:2]